MKYVFADMVVVNEREQKGLIGVIVKSWVHSDDGIIHDVYVRSLNRILPYTESEIERYLVRHKYLNDEDREYQANAINE